MQKIQNKYLENWSEDAKDLSECSDVMPVSIKQHQRFIYQACLDMAYRVEEKYIKKIEKFLED